jgi:hypothetical protein
VAATSGMNPGCANQHRSFRPRLTQIHALNAVGARPA